MKLKPFCFTLITIGSLGASATVCQAGSGTWIDKIPTPVTNPLFFEEAQIRSDVRPLFMHHNLGNNVDSDLGPLPLGGDAQVFAIQLRYAINDRLAIIATKDGYIDFNPDATLAKDEGFADIGFGIKYAIIHDDENQFILTPLRKTALRNFIHSI